MGDTSFVFEIGCRGFEKPSKIVDVYCGAIVSLTTQLRHGERRSVDIHPVNAILSLSKDGGCNRRFNSEEFLLVNSSSTNAAGNRNSGRRLLCSIAHPDDETFGSGSTLIKYASEGATVFTACATRGDVGEIAEGADATPETLSDVREQEYYDAGKVLGVQQSILYGYRDSGMAGTTDNDHPNAYIQVPMDEVVAKIVDTIRELKPHVVFTFDEGGGYGHPDHMHASEATRLAYFAAGDPSYKGSSLAPWKASKFYFQAFPRSIMSAWIAAEAKRDPASNFAKLDVEQMDVPDESMTASMDVAAHIETRRNAVKIHRTQASPFDRMPTPELASRFMSTDYFIRIDPPIAENESGITEHDLFEGLDI